MGRCGHRRRAFVRRTRHATGREGRRGSSGARHAGDANDHRRPEVDRRDTEDAAHGGSSPDGLQGDVQSTSQPAAGDHRGCSATFVTMVMGAVNTIMPVTNNSAVISANLFTDPSMRGDPHHNMPSPFTQVSCEQWLTAIATPGGSDLLSAGLYPIRRYYYGLMNDRTDVKANELLGSMGALHNRLDPGNRPIFEIRSSKQIYAGLIPAYALDFFKYVRYLHNPHGLTETSFLTGLTANDVAALVGFTPNRAAVVQNLQTQSFARHKT